MRLRAWTSGDDEAGDPDGLPQSPLRWGLGFLLIVGLHAGSAWLALHWMDRVVPAPAPPPAAIMIDLAPLPAAAPTPPNELPPGPKQTNALPPPESALRQPLPEAPPSPAQQITVPVPPKSKPQPVLHRRQTEDRPPPKRSPDEMPAAPATTAPPQLEAPSGPAAAAPAPGASSMPSSDAAPAWRGLLLARLEQFKRYPMLAQYRRQQGVAFLRFTIDRNGKVLSAQIEKSSGYDMLDEETLALIHRAEPLPKPPPEAPGDPVELIVPIQFFLRSRG